MAVTRARVLRWLRLESSGDGGSNQSAAVEAGLKQGSAGWLGHGCGRTGLRARLHWELQGTLGGQGMAAAGLDSGRGCTWSFRARWEGENIKWLFG